MRAFKIEIKGYKRLADTSCNVAGRMIAFLGPNEAGKSSLLNALDWFSHGDQLASKLANRAQTLDPNSAVVRVYFHLSDEDRAALDGLGLQGEIRTFVRAKYPQGEVKARLEPAPVRDPDPFERAEELLSALHQRIDEMELPLAELSETSTDIKEYVDYTRRHLSDREGSWDPDWDEELENFLTWLQSLALDREYTEALREAVAKPLATQLTQVREILRAAHPIGVARQRLLELVPDFLTFTAEDRELRTEYDFSDSAFRTDPPAALANLTWVADLDLEQLWSFVSSDDTARLRTLLRQANSRLNERLGSRWHQEKITVEFNINGTILEILVVEQGEDGSTTPIDERSDGFRIFIALVAFLARRDFSIPPVLLIDEIETHLHLNAQADLVEVLANDVQASQVFYTTHSPASLPRDLGTGLRLVEPSAHNRSSSQLKNDFWSSDRIGFAPILFSMGASAAAMSAFRKALIVEGPSDMILLPTLFRTLLATDDLGYQIVPGIPSARGAHEGLNWQAVQLAYLLDGDAGGDAHQATLIELGVDSNRIERLPSSTALEDLVQPSVYLAVVEELLAERHRKDVLKEFTATTTSPIGKQVADWCKGNDIAAPGKPAVAAAIVDRWSPDHVNPAHRGALLACLERIGALLNTTG